MVTNMIHQAEKNDEGEERTVTLSLRDVRAVLRVLSRFMPPDATGLERRLLESPSKSTPSQESARGDLLKWNALVQAAEEEYRARRRRGRLLGTAMFGEPAWDMLVALFINGAGEKLTVSRLTRFSGTAGTTALRWLNYLEQERLIERESNPTDARSVFVRLSDRGERILETYFSETLKMPS